MHEQIVAEAAAIDEAAQEVDVRGGDRAPHDLHQLARRLAAHACRVDSVALQTFQAAEPQPAGDHTAVAIDDAQQDFLVIAEDENRPNAGAVVGSKAFDDLSRAGAPVDEVADEDEQRLGYRAVLKIGVDFRQQIFEKIMAAVNVSDHVCPISSRSGGRLWLP